MTKFTATRSESGVVISLVGGPFKKDAEEYVTDDDVLIKEIIEFPEITRDYFFRSCGINLARGFWENPNLTTEEKPDQDALVDMLYNDNLMMDYHDTMTQDDFDSVELGIYEYFEKELIIVDYDEENVAEEFWGEIFARYNAAQDSGVDDRIARILAIHLPYTCTKDEAKEIYKYAIQIPGYFSDDEKAPEALIRREQVIDDE